MKRLVTTLALAVALTACGNPQSPPELPPTQHKAQEWRGTVEEITLSDGTLCVVWWEDITCDWKARES